MWCHLFNKFASYKVPPVMVSTHGSVVPLAMFVVFKPHTPCLGDIIFTIGDNDCDFWKVFALGRPLQLRVIQTLLEPDWSICSPKASGDQRSGSIENWQESGGLINSGRFVRCFQINLKPPRVVLCLCASSKSVIAADNHREFAALYIHRCLWPFMGDVCQLRSQWLRPGVLVSLRTILLE